MTEKNNDLFGAEVDGRANNRWTISPKEIIFKYLHYLPWVAISVVLFIFFAYLKIRYTTPIFQVQASLLIKNDQDLFSSKEERFNDLFMPKENINLRNEMEILRSRPVMTRVARNLNLQYRYYSKGTVRSSLMYPSSPISMKILQIGDSSIGFNYKITALNQEQFLLNENKTPMRFGQPIKVGNDMFVLESDPNVHLNSFASQIYEMGWSPLPSVVEGLIGSLKVGQNDDRTTILALTFENESPLLGQDVLNMLMAVYDSLIVEDKNRITTNTLRFIDSRLYELNDTLKGVQDILKNFMVENQAYDIEGQSKAYLDKVSESSKASIEQEVKMNVINWLLEYIGNKKNNFELVPTNLGIDEPALLQLIAEYNKLQLQRESNLKTTPAINPLIVGLETSLEKVRSNIYQALLNVKQAYLIASGNLAKQDKELQQRITGLPGKSMRLLNIERQQRILEELYTFLLQKKLETSISSASTVSNSRIIESAMGSNIPVRPDKRSLYSLYFLIGLMIPVGIIVVSELLHDKVGSRIDVEKNTKAPILGEVGHSKNSQALIVTSNSRRFISEQFRIIRTNLQYMIGKKERPVIMVTSSFSGEGKSFISTNMGAVMALSGKKTVIMEFDIRKPKIVSGLDLKRKMGITNYIIGKANFEDLLVKVEGVDNLYVIPCGPIPPNPSELLLDKRLDELMGEVMDHFEVVIMDTAPVGLVSDAVNLGRFADSTLYIVRQGYTFKRQLSLIEELYNSKKLPGLCLLLNDIRVEGGYYGGYYGSYGYYGYGYGKESGYFEEEGHKAKPGFFKRLRKQWKGKSN